MAKRVIDHTTIREGGPPQRSDSTRKEWWSLPDDELPNAVTGVVEHIKQNSGKLEQQRQISARLYGNISIVGLAGISFSRSQTATPGTRDRISYNVVKSVIDTVTSKIAKNKPKPLFLTSGGDYKIQRKAKKLTKFTEGIFYENEMRKLAPRIFRDAGIFGDGFLHVFAQDKRVRFERVMASELYVDEIEAFYGYPRQMHRAKNVDRRQLAAMMPKHAKAIMDDDGATPEELGGADYQVVADQVAVVESWHLPSGPKADDGRHTICLRDEILFSEEWEKPFFPFARLPWSDAVFGYWSRGLAEDLQNIQLEMNKLLWLIQRSMHLMGTFKIALEHGSKVNTAHLNNEIGAIVYYKDKLPVYLTPQVVPAEYYQHFERLRNAAYEQAGISMLSAASQKPAGLDSGKALREYNDIESDRFQVVGQAYENFHLDAAKVAISVARDIYGDTDPRRFEVKVPGKKFIETIDWKDINLQDDEFVMQVYPISSLPQDPAGRLQTVQEMVQGGLLPEYMRNKLLDFPDLEQFETLDTAELDWIIQTLEKIVDEGDFAPPDPAMNPQLARTLALQYYAAGSRDGLEEERLDLLRTFIDQLDAMQAKAQAAMAPPPGAPGMAPPTGAPMAPPPSDLIPNAPGGMPAVA